jgi:hypothetical protein
VARLVQKREKRKWVFFLILVGRTTHCVPLRGDLWSVRPNKNERKVSSFRILRPAVRATTCAKSVPCHNVCVMAGAINNGRHTPHTLCTSLWALAPFFLFYVAQILMSLLLSHK